MNNVYVLAKALVYVRTGIASYRDTVVKDCMLAIGTETGGRTLALGRELAAYVIYVGFDPTLVKEPEKRPEKKPPPKKPRASG